MSEAIEFEDAYDSKLLATVRRLAERVPKKTDPDQDPLQPRPNPGFSYSLMAYDADLNCGTKAGTIEMLDRACVFSNRGSILF